MGALVAFEMTRQLEAVGETVAFLGILDSPALEFGLDLGLDALRGGPGPGAADPGDR